MSTSEQTQRPVALRRDELTMSERRVLDGDTTRTDRAVSWLGWHVMELTGITVPLLAAVAVNGWCAVVSVAVGAGWAGHKARQARRDRPRHTPAAADASNTDRDNEDNEDDGGDGEQQDREVSA